MVLRFFKDTIDAAETCSLLCSASSSIDIARFPPVVVSESAVSSAIGDDLDCADPAGDDGFVDAALIEGVGERSRAAEVEVEVEVGDDFCDFLDPPLRLLLPRLEV